VNVESLHVGYGKMAALWDISFEIPKGVIVGILGPNGAGKSTLFKAMMGLIKLYSGKIDFAWRKKLPMSRNESQSTGFPDPRQKK